MKTSEDGFVWLEILIAISACVFISLTGMRALSLLLDQWAKQQAADLEEREIHGLGDRMQRFFDQRMDSRFVDKPGLNVEGHSVAGGLSLDCVQLRVQQFREAPEIWKLEREDGRWYESMGHPDDADRDVRQLKYEGDILVLMDSAGASGQPPVMVWTFPGCTSRLAQEGFAIFAFW